LEYLCLEAEDESNKDWSAFSKWVDFVEARAREKRLDLDRLVGSEETVMGKAPAPRSMNKAMDLLKAYTLLDALFLVVGLRRIGFLSWRTWYRTRMNNCFYVSGWKIIGKGRCTHSRVGFCPGIVVLMAQGIFR
jgi:hypothetical protein